MRFGMKTRIAVMTLIAAFAVAGRGAALNVNDGQELEALVRRVASHVTETTQAGNYEWNWGENLIMRGLIRAYEVTGDESYFTFVTKWLDKYCVGSGLYMPLEVDDVASAYSATLAYEITGKKKYLKCTGTAMDFLDRSSPRLSDGSIVHNPSGQLWLDTLYMIAPLLARYGKVKSDNAKIDMAAKQILQNVRRTESPETHLSYHMWDPEDGHSPHFWARGNGWVVMATAEVLEVTPADRPQRDELVSLLNRRLDAIIKLQDESGLWHTVLDRPDSYLEVSASAMYAFAIERGVRRGWLPESMLNSALRALRAIEPYIEKDGKVTGVSAGTGPGDFANYMRIKTGEYTWGTGAVLLAFSERIEALRDAK